MVSASIVRLALIAALVVLSGPASAAPLTDDKAIWSEARPVDIDHLRKHHRHFYDDDDALRGLPDTADPQAPDPVPEPLAWQIIGSWSVLLLLGQFARRRRTVRIS